MHTRFLLMLFLLMSADTVGHAQLYPVPDDGALLGPLTPNAYGPGINSDATGRPFYWGTPGQTQPNPTLQPNINQYGFGQSADQYGRPIQPMPLDRQPGSRPNLNPGGDMNGPSGPFR